jgi:hypothetical protein
MRKENCKGEEHKKFPSYPLGGCSSLSSPHQKSSVQLQYVKTLKNSNQSTADRWGSVRDPAQQPQQEIQKTGLSVKSPSSSDNDKLKVATVVRQSSVKLYQKSTK